MKHIGLYILLICIVLVGCSDKYSTELGLKPTLTPRYLRVSPTSLSFSANQTSSQSVDIETMETPWKVDNAIDWVSISAANGQSNSNINVSTSENKDANAARTGVFYIKADVSDWNYEKGISVSQAAATPYINVSQSNITLKGTACTATFNITSNCSYTVTNDADWLTLSQKDNSFVLNATANETSQYRTTTILFSYNGIGQASNKIVVTQAPASINASTKTLTFENTAGEIKVEVTSESKWTASTSYSWINVTPNSGEAGTSSITISVSPNTSVDERTGYVILSIGSEKRIQIPIKQRGIYIETDKSQYDFDASSGTQTIQVNSNTSWQVSSVPSWIKVDKTSGTGNSAIKVTVEDNPNTTERDGEFVVSQPGLSAMATVKVHQKGKTFDVAVTTLTFNDKEESQTITIATDGTWRAFSSADWIKVSPETATGNSTLTITVQENATDGERSGSVNILMGDASATVAIVQKGKYFTIDNSLLDFTSKGGELKVSLTTNASWAARKDDTANWLSISPTNGTDNTTVKVTASDNASVNNRSANVYFDALGRSVNIFVSQKARYLTVDANELLFYSKGGTSNAVTISTDGTYSINCSDNWLTISRNGDSFTVTASENGTQETRIGKITISLTDLKEGSYSVTLTVTQLNYGGTFLRKDFEEDKNYDSKGSSTGGLTITGYGSDTNYDTSSQSGTKLSVVGFKADTSWDSSTNSSAKVTITGFKSDQSLDSTANSSGTMQKNDFSNDSNWNY